MSTAEGGWSGVERRGLRSRPVIGSPSSWCQHGGGSGDVDHTASGMSTERVLALLEAHGVLASDRPPTHFRLVTNRHHDGATIEEAARRIRRAMAAV